MVQMTPPMGWNSWNTFGNNISEELIQQTADTMVSSGLRDAGYTYLVIDDCWAEMQRDQNHRLAASKAKFPNGMKAVSDYVHSKGLKFGMYSCVGNMTCAGYPASFGYEFLDAQTFAEWGIDYLKYDYCYKPNYQPGHLLYKRMGAALANCGRDILFSACSWGADDTKSWIKSTGAHLWRSTGDIFDTWQSVKDLSMQQVDLQPYNAVNCFNDMDMLIVGMHGKGNVGLSGCTDEEYRTHFSLWALLNSPLMIGCDIRSMTEETKQILMNSEVIAINQDASGRQPYLTNNDRDHMIWIKLLSNGDFAIGLFNFGDNPTRMFVPWVEIGLDKNCGKGLSLRDVWKKEELGVFEDMYFSPVIGAHECQLLRGKLADIR